MNRKIKILVAVVVVLLINMPIYWIIQTSLLPEDSLRTYPPVFFPTNPQWDTYTKIFQSTDILSWLGNSFLIGTIVVIISLFIGIPSAYSLSRFKYRFTRYIGLSMLVSQMLPPTLLAIPLFIILRSFHLTTTPIGSLFAVILSHSTLVIPFMIWMLKGYFDTIPIEIEQSAWIDGSSRLSTLLVIVLPLARPGIAAATMYGFVLSWNDYIFSKTFVVGMKPLWTVSIGIASFKGEFVTPWNQVMAVSLLSAIPIICIMIFLQKHFVSGLTGGSIK